MSRPEPPILPGETNRITHVDALYQAQAIYVHHRSGPSEPFRLFQVPQRNVNFVGRQAELDALGAKTGLSILAATISAAGGFGKTEIATEYAHRRLGEGWELIWWIDATTPDTVAVGLNDLCEALGLPVGEDLAATIGHLWPHLQHVSVRWLIVFDNLNEVGPLRGNLPTAAGAEAQIVVTTRDSHIVRRLGGYPIQVEELPPADAVRLISELIRRTDDPDLPSLCERLGYHPLALSQAAGFINTVQLSTAGYLKLIEADLEKAMSLPGDRSQARITTLWNTTLTRLDGATVDVLRRMAFCHSHAIPAELLRTPDLDYQAVQKALIEAARYHLVRIIQSDDSGPAVVSVHQLTQHAITTNNPEPASSIGLLADALAGATRGLDLDLPAGWPTFQRLTPHALRLLDAAEDRRDLSESTRSAVATGALLQARVLMARRLFHRADPILRNVAACLDTLSSPDRAMVLTVRSLAATCLGEAGRVEEAIEALAALLVDRINALGERHPDVLRTRNNLASSLADAGRVAESIIMFETVLHDRIDVMGESHPDVLETRNNLASSLADAGRIDESIAAFEKLIPDMIAVLGRQHPNVLSVRNNLAGSLRTVGRVDEAIASFEALLVDLALALGPHHPDTLGTRSNLATALSRGGRGDEAIAALEALLTDRIDVLGERHPDVLLTRNNLALSMAEVGRLDEAIAAFEALLPDQIDVLGPRHPLVGITRGNLASLLARGGRGDEAIAATEALLTDRIDVLGERHPDVFVTRNNLASLMAEAGRVDEAIAAFEVLLSDMTNVLAENHSTRAITTGNLRFWINRRADDELGDQR